MILLTTQGYLRILSKSIPENIIEFSIIALFTGLLLLIAHKGVRKGLKYGLRLLLADHVLLLLCSTVFFRRVSSVAKFSYLPFRTYQEFFCNDNIVVLLQALINILVFIPVGMLLKESFCSWKWWQLLLIGCGLSVMIETLQLVFHRGFCEIDDVMHNGVGCLIGILFYRGFLKMTNSWF